MQKSQYDIFIGVPCYGNQVGEGAVKGLLLLGSSKLPKTISFSGFSVLTRNFNILWTQALNARSRGITHFCMIHGDISPIDTDWLDKMVALMEKHDADILSVVSPIKDSRGLTSTAIDEPIGDAPLKWRMKRLTLPEIHSNYPSTFTHPKLLVNTGLMLVKLTESWCEKLWFEFEDQIMKRPDGEWGAVGVSEDWAFSRKANALGLKLFATTEVRIHHIGSSRFSNGNWGSLQEDEINA